MGIKNLYKLLRRECPNIFKSEDLSVLDGKRVAVDTSLYMYKYKSISGDRWIVSMVQFLIEPLLSSNVKSIFIFDGKPPPEKLNTLNQRVNVRKNSKNRIQNIKHMLDVYVETKVADDELIKLSKSLEKKNTSSQIQRLIKLTSTTSLDKSDSDGSSDGGVIDIDIEMIKKYIEKLESRDINITPQDYSDLKSLLTFIGIPYMDSPYEAETLCSHLCILGYVDCVMSEDSDVLVYGTPMFITKLSGNGCVVIKYSDILDELEMSFESFRDLCIMCGSDYNPNIPKIASIKAYKIISELESLERVSEKYDTTCLNYKRVRELFSCPDKLPDEIVNKCVWTKKKKQDHQPPQDSFIESYRYSKSLKRILNITDDDL